MQAETRHEDALRIYQRVGASGDAAADPALRQASLEGSVAALVALGRRDQADALLDQAEVREMSGTEAGDSCDARMSLARGRVETGEVEGMAIVFASILDTCSSPRFLVENLSIMADMLVEAGVEDKAAELLIAARDTSETPAGRQAAELELGRLGSLADLKAAAKGPDPALAALALVARAEILVGEGRLAEAEPLWIHVADDPAVEPVPKGLALLGLAQLEVARGNRAEAQARLEELRRLTSDPWLLGRADGLAGELAVPAPASPVAASPVPAGSE
jgi:hypothetical protein